MQFEELSLGGAYRIRISPARDERGFFARTICVADFAKHGLNGSFVQSSISHNLVRGTVRGMHFQWPPSAEAKLVRCTKGGIVDVILDLRPASPTFLGHVKVMLDEASRDAVYIPPGFAHGFQTLTDDAEVSYHMTEAFSPDLADGFRWNDPAFSIELPLPPAVISARDAGYPDFDKGAYTRTFAERDRHDI